MSTNAKTTLTGAVAGLSQLAGQLFPKYKALADGVSAFALVLFGYVASDK